MTPKSEKRLNRLVDNYNAYITSKVTLCGGERDIFLDKSSTCISAPEIVEDATITFDGRFAKVKIQGCEISIYEYIEEDGYVWLNHGIEELKDTIRYFKHCIDNGVKWYQSENPDEFLEQADDDEE